VGREVECGRVGLVSIDRRLGLSKLVLLKNGFGKTREVLTAELVIAALCLAESAANITRQSFLIHRKNKIFIRIKANFLTHYFL
jgi:hypothetical protein